MADKIQDFEVNSQRWLSLEDFEGEFWKNIQGYEGLYVVSNYGRVKSLERKIPCKKKGNSNSYVVVHEKIKCWGDNGNGYCITPLCKSGKSKMFYIHRLVAQAFIPNPLNLPDINHKDEDKRNNSVCLNNDGSICVEKTNLEWCTCLYNNMYGTAKERMKKTRIENGNNRAIDMYDLYGNLLKHYEIGYHMERDGLSRRGVYNVCCGRAKSYKGCIFVFHGDEFRKKEIDSYPKGCTKKVIVTDFDGNVIKTYDSIKQAERENGLSRNYLYSATYASTRKAKINGLYFEIKKY